MRSDNFLRDEITILNDLVYDLKAELDDVKTTIKSAIDFPISWGISPTEKKILELIYTAKGMVTYDLMYTICYYHKVNPPGDWTIKTHIHNIRKKVKKYGVVIDTHRAEGFSMSADSKKILSEYKTKGRAAC